MNWRLLASAMLFLLVACGTEPAVVTATGGPDAELAEARLLWAEAGLDAYRYELEDDCGECDPSARLPQRVTVRNGETSEPDRPTVEELFERIEQAIDEGRSVQVDYHPELGHPTDISIDMEARAYDGGTHLMIRDLAALEGQ